MENIQMLIPIDPKDFWAQLKIIIEEAVKEKKDQSPAYHKERPLLKAKEVGEIFQVSKTTLYDWLNRGKLKSVKIQSRRYFHWEDVEALIQQSKVQKIEL